VTWVRGGIETPGRPEKLKVQLPPDVKLEEAPEGDTCRRCWIAARSTPSSAARAVLLRPQPEGGLAVPGPDRRGAGLLPPHRHLPDHARAGRAQGTGGAASVAAGGLYKAFDAAKNDRAGEAGRSLGAQGLAALPGRAGMCWHEHRHDGSEPVVWLDVLDVPLHQNAGTVLFEPGPMSDTPATMPDAAFAAPNIVPYETTGRSTHSPVFRYPYADAVRALAHAPASPDGARRVRYINPLTGAGAMPLLDTTMIQFDAGVRTLPVRSNANLVCTVVDGHGESRIGDQVLAWAPRDTFTIPQHHWATHRSLDGAARLFIVSDADVLRRLGLLTEETRIAPLKEPTP
jgi:hypothetical protein